MFFMCPLHLVCLFSTTSQNSLCTLILRASLLCVAKWYRIRKEPRKILIFIQYRIVCDNSGHFTHGKTGAEEWSNHFHLEEGAWDGVFLPVRQVLQRKEVLELVWFPTQGFYFVVENLIFPRPFLWGLSLKSALYWEIGMKSTALKRIKAFVSKMYIFFGTVKAVEQEMVLSI